MSSISPSACRHLEISNNQKIYLVRKVNSPKATEYEMDSELLTTTTARIAAQEEPTIAARTRRPATRRRWRRWRRRRWAGAPRRASRRGARRPSACHLASFTYAVTNFSLFFAKYQNAPLEIPCEKESTTFVDAERSQWKNEILLKRAVDANSVGSENCDVQNQHYDNTANKI